MKVRRLVLRLVPLFLGTTSIVFADKSAKEYLEEGDVRFSEGAYDDALKSFSAAIELDSTDYLSYFKRAATYLSLRRSTSAIEDFSRILELKPDFDQALLQRAKLYLKGSSLTEARDDLNRYLEKNPEDTEASRLLESVDQVDSNFKAADDSHKAAKYGECVKHLSEAAKHVSQSIRLYMTRATCHLENNEVSEGVADLSRASQLNPSDTGLCLRLSKLKYFALYNSDESKQHVKQCLHYDPEDKSCKTMHRLIKRLEKQVDMIRRDIEGHRWQTAINKIFGSSKDKGLLVEVEEERQKMNEGLGAAELQGKLHSWACKAYVKLKDNKNAVQQCTEALKTEGDNPSAENLINRGEAYILSEEYDAATQDFSKAHDATDGADKRAAQGYQRARRLLEQSKKRDYYKVLGVPRAASKQEIKKAYHKLAQQWHPDKYKGTMSPDEVATKMSAINQAYEVLYNDELRQRYDQGEDPNDPNGGDGQAFYGQNPFMHFGGFGNGFSGFTTFKFESDDGRGQYRFKWP